MKKALTLFIVVFICIGIPLTFTACQKPYDNSDEQPHVHEYVDGVCICGEQESPTNDAGDNVSPEITTEPESPSHENPEPEENENEDGDLNEQPQKTHEQIFQDAFLLDTNFTATLAIISPDESAINTYKRANNLFEIYEKTITSNVETTTFSTYWEVLDGACFKYENKQDVYEKTTSSATIDSLMNEIYVKLIYGGTGSNLQALSNYIYDSEKNQYTSDNINCYHNLAGMVLSTTFSNVILQLDSNNRLQSIDCIVSTTLSGASSIPDSDDSYQLEILITYDTTAITLPTI